MKYRLSGTYRVPVVPEHLTPLIRTDDEKLSDFVREWFYENRDALRGFDFKKGSNDRDCVRWLFLEVEGKNMVAGAWSKSPDLAEFARGAYTSLMRMGVGPKNARIAKALKLLMEKG